MIDWNLFPWKVERAASEFAHRVMDDLTALRPTVLCQLGWAGIEVFERALMAAWLSRQIVK